MMMMPLVVSTKKLKRWWNEQRNEGEVDIFFHFPNFSKYARYRDYGDENKQRHHRVTRHSWRSPDGERFYSNCDLCRGFRRYGTLAKNCFRFNSYSSHRVFTPRLWFVTTEKRDGNHDSKYATHFKLLWIHAWRNPKGFSWFRYCKHTRCGTSERFWWKE